MTNNAEQTNATIIVSPSDLIGRFNEVMRESFEHPQNDDLLKRANEIAEQIINITSLTYDKICNMYREVRGNVMKDIDKRVWDVLNEYIGRYISNVKQNVSILDIGTGNGRDLIHGQGLGYDIIGTDNCDGFIEILTQHSTDGLLKANSFRKCDMRSLDFQECSFDVVRHNATLLHMPLIGKGYTVDLALSEAYRVLKPNGLLYVFVKTGSSLELQDTNEGLGGRVFQFFTHKMLNDAVFRNNFTILFTSDEVEVRGHSIIDWILLIAQKNS